MRFLSCKLMKKDGGLEMENTSSEGTIWMFSPVCSSTSLYSKTTNLGPFEMSGHHVLVSSPPSIFLPTLFLNIQTSSPPYLFNVQPWPTPNVRSSDDSTTRISVARAWRITRGKQQLPIMNSGPPTHRQPYVPTTVA